MDQIITNFEDAGSETVNQLLNIMNATTAEEVTVGMDKLEKIYDDVKVLNQPSESDNFQNSNPVDLSFLEAELYAAKKEIKSLSDVQRVNIANVRKNTQARKLELQAMIRQLNIDIRLAQKRNQETSKVIKTVDRVQRREAKAIEEAQKAAARQARRDARAMQEAERAEARKARENVRAMKRQIALNSAAARTAAALVREQAAAAALAALAQTTKPVRRTRVKKEAVSTETAVATETE